MSRRDDLYAKGKEAIRRGALAAWEAVEVMVELTNLGETQRQIATGLGCHQGTVSRYISTYNSVLELDASRIKRPELFTEKLTALYSSQYKNRSLVPGTPEKQVELAAKLLERKAVADAPAVREVQQRNADRRLREETATYNREHNIPSRAEKERLYRLQRDGGRDSFWRDTLWALQAAIKAANEAYGEIGRTGLPRHNSGDIIRATRALAQAAVRLDNKATEAGIGEVAG